MPDNSNSIPNEIPKEAAHALTRSYENLLGQQEWEPGDCSDALSAGNEAPEPVETGSPPPLKRIVEALLFVGGAPLTPAGAAEVVRGLTAEQFTETIAELNQDYRRQGRPYVIRLHDPLIPPSLPGGEGRREGGYVLELRPRYKPVWDQLYGTMREARLSTAAIDVLALVAYRQPATKQEIDSIRGTESGHLLRQLVRRRLIAIIHPLTLPSSPEGNGKLRGREVSYGTTERFLELFGLKSLDDLPQTQDLQKL